MTTLGTGHDRPHAYVTADGDTVLDHGHGQPHAYRTVSTSDTQHTAMAVDHPDFPHQTTIHRVQSLMRGSFPDLYRPLPDDEFDRDAVLGKILHQGGHPQAHQAFVMDHPRPDKGVSCVVAAPNHKGEMVPGIALHSSRNDYGTLAHEAAHLLHHHAEGIDPFGQHDDETQHGPAFAEHYRRTLGMVHPEASQFFAEVHPRVLRTTQRLSEQEKKRGWFRRGKKKVRKTEKPQKCQYCKAPATQSLLWAEGMGYIPVCDKHEARARYEIEDVNEDEVVGVHEIQKAAARLLTCETCGGTGTEHNPDKTRSWDCRGCDGDGQRLVADHWDPPNLHERHTDALDTDDYGSRSRKLLDLAKTPDAGTHVWRGEVRHKDDVHAPPSVGMHWSVNPNQVIFPPHIPRDHHRVVWQAVVDHPEKQTIPRSHPIWHGQSASMDNEAEVRFKPGAQVRLNRAYVHHGETGGGMPVPRHSERTDMMWQAHEMDHHTTVEHKRPADGMMEYQEKFPDLFRHEGARDDDLIGQLTFAHHRNVEGERDEIHAHHPDAGPSGDGRIPNWAGHISWFPDGEIAGVAVSKAYQRRGLATELWNRAKQVEPRLRHSDIQSGAGRAWAATTAAQRHPDIVSTYGTPFVDVGKYFPAGGVDKIDQAPWHSQMRYHTPEEWAAHPVEELPISSLHRTQNHHQTIRHPWSDSYPAPETLPQVVRHQGRDWLIDGHHRVVNDVDSGRDTVRAHVMTLHGRTAATEQGQAPGHEWRSTLPEDHEAVVRQYETYSPGMTSQQRAQFRKIVKSAPVVDGPVYRGVSVKGAYGFKDKIEAAHPVGKVVNVSKHVSTSTRPEVAAGYGSTVYEIHGHGARAIGNGLHEAMMPPGKFRVHSAEWRDSPSQASIDESTMYSAPRLHVVLHPVEAKQAAQMPSQRLFGPTHGLDHRLFDGDHLKPDARRYILETLSGFWTPRYGHSWAEWSRVYFAGSEASEWTSPTLEGNGDFDVLIGVDYDRARNSVPRFAQMSDEDITATLNAELRVLDERTAHAMIPVEGNLTGPWSNTWYVNSHSYDIRNIKPYAAYNVSDDKWAVRPPHLPDWSVADFPEGPALVDEARAYEKLVGAILALPEPYRSQQGAALWDHLHGDRSRAFGPQGEGWYDPGNVIEKWLDQRGLWEKLVEIKMNSRANPASLNAPNTWSNDPQN